MSKSVLLPSDAVHGVQARYALLQQCLSVCDRRIRQFERIVCTCCYSLIAYCLTCTDTY